MVKTKTTKPSKAYPNRGRPSNQSTNNDDEELTITDLRKMSVEALRQKCQKFQLLTTGKKDALVDRLHEHYHPTVIDPPPDIQIGDEAALPDEEAANQESVDTVAYGADRTNQDPADKSPNESSEEEDETDGRVKINLQEVVQGVIENSVGEEMRTMAAQMEAFKSILTSMKDKQQQQQPQPTLVSTNTPASVTATRTSPRKRKSGDVNNDGSSSKRSKQSSSSGSKSTSTGSAGMNYYITNTNLATPLSIDTSHRSTTTKSPFRLPAISKTFIDQIEKGEYVDFDRMKAKKANSKSRDTNHSEYNLKINEKTNESTLELKKSKKETVNNFNEWQRVWNDYLHAYCHFRPEEVHLLLTYQKHIADFASIYKFEAVRDYDIDFRNHLANQRSDPPEERTVFWDKQSIELKNLDLADHPKPPPHCYNCNEKGHMSNECQKPSKKQSKNASQQNFLPPTYAPYHPPPPPPRPPTTTHQQSNRQKPGTTSAPAGMDTTDRANYCRGFNSQGECSRGFRCRWLHYCNKCG